MKTKLKKSLVLLLMCTMVLGIKVDVFAAGITYVYDDVNTVASLTNQFRADNPWYLDSNEQKQQCGSLPALNYDYNLEKLAMIRAAEITSNFSHTRPDGTDIGSEVINSLGMSVSAENIASGQTSANEVVEAWKETDKSYNGQGHRRNMLGVNGAYTSIGVGHVRANGIDYWVQLFGTGNGGGSREDLNGTAASTPDNNQQNSGTATPDNNQPDVNQSDNNPPAATPDASQPDNSQTADGNTGIDLNATIPNIIPSTQYNFVSGSNNTWTKGSGKSMVMKTDGDFSKFVNVEIDGAVVDSSNYIAESGSTVVTFGASYMETLSAGKHTYRVNYTDGYAETTFTVNGTVVVNSDATVKAPKTGDSTAVTTSMILMLLAFSGMAASQLLRKHAR